jgi:hypothetical protein
MFLTSGEDSHHRERKKIERNTRAKRERKHTKREREKRTKKEKKALSLLSLCFCSSVSLSLSPLSLVFFFGSPFSLSLKSFSLSGGGVSRFPLSRNSDESAREVFRERHFAAQKRARFNARKEREREREKETRERARANTLYRRKFLSFALSLRHYREELTTTRKTEYSFLSCTRKTENSHVFPGKPSS